MANIAVDCDKFMCSACPENSFNVMPANVACQQCPMNMGTQGLVAQKLRSSCLCDIGYVGGCNDDIEVSGFPNGFLNGRYTSGIAVFGRKSWKRGTYGIYSIEKVIDQGQERFPGLDPATFTSPCNSMWVLGTAANERPGGGVSITNIVAVTTVCIESMPYSDFPPSGPVWQAPKAGTIALAEYNFINIDCPSTSACTMCKYQVPSCAFT